MRLPLIPILAVLMLNGLVDYYIYRQLLRWKSPAKLLVRQLWAILSIVLALVLVTAICWPKKEGGNETLTWLMWLLFSYFSIYIPKYLYVLPDLLASIPRIWNGRRLKVLSLSGGVLAAVSFALMWWGALINRNRIQVKEVTVEIANLPESFSGMTIAQFSDIHVGTFGNDTTFISKLVDRINSLQPDMIVFTGDIVNRRSDELEPFISTLSGLHAPIGVYSILGNHDYGDYYQWSDSTAKADNLDYLKAMQAGMGWIMLNNATAYIHAGTDSIALVGVENVGDPPFPSYGDLDEAYPGDLDDPTVKILLSHNPAHWCEDICDAPDKNIALTLSGHTHAMQIELFGLSPAVFRYRTWGGMYRGSGGNDLYVNIGAGEVAIPARIGATPEITLFTLKPKR